MDTDRIAAAFFTASLICIISVFALAKASPPSNAFLADLHSLQEQLAVQKSDIAELNGKITTINARLAKNSSSLPNESPGQSDSSKNDEFEKTSFLATENLTWFVFVATFIITVASVILALWQFLRIEKTVRNIAREEITESNRALNGRLHYIVGMVFSNITWDMRNDYALNPQRDLSHMAIDNATLAYESLRGCKYSEGRELFALNNLLFYTTLLPSSSATPARANEAFERAVEMLELQKKERAFPDYKRRKPLIINTYCRVMIVFRHYIGNEPLARQKLAIVRTMLEENRLSPHATETNRRETSRLLAMLAEIDFPPDYEI